jgi:hypothetical protein
MRRRPSALIFALALPTLASGKAAAQTAAQPAPAAPAEAAPAPAPPATDTTAAPPPEAPAMPAPVETAMPAPAETTPAPPPAAAAPPPATVFATSSAPPPAPQGLQRFGITLGIISLPRPIEIEGHFRLSEMLAVSGQYSMLPDLQAPGGSAKLQLRAFQGIARWFPFSGSFFIGAGLGYQTFRASLSKTVENHTLETTADLSGVFVSPQLGWLFVWQSGFALGLTFGAQIPLPKDPVATSTYNGQPVPSQPGNGVSQEVIDQAKDNQDTVTTLGKLANKYPLPNIELLRLGFFF